MKNRIVSDSGKYNGTIRLTPKLHLLFTIFLLGIGFNQAFAQKAHITGIVKASKGEVVPYASVALNDSTRERPVAGTVSDSTGHFSLSVKPGSYTLKITFLSFKPYRRQIVLQAGERKPLGVIRLEPTTQSMQNVVVRGKRSQMELTFEKRTFQVGKDITSPGGSALDVLNNVPSLTTDFNGTISLRGSSAVRILINGKPSGIYKNGSKALQSLSANMIKESAGHYKSLSQILGGRERGYHQYCTEEKTKSRFSRFGGIHATASGGYPAVGQFELSYGNYQLVFQRERRPC